MKLTQDQIDEANQSSKLFYALRKDTPGKFWELNCKSPLDDAQALKSVSNVLNLDPTDPMVAIACQHIRLGKVSGSHHLVIPYPIPKPRDLPDGSNLGLWIDIRQILVWNPATDVFHLLGDDTPQLFGNHATGALYGHPKQFLQYWYRNIAQHLELIKIRSAQKWKSVPKMTDVCPGALLIGPPPDIPWPIPDMPRKLTVTDLDPKVINRSIVKAANLPWVK